MAEFKRQLERRQTGEVTVRGGEVAASTNGASGGWTVIDGTGKTCAGILAALSEQVAGDGDSLRRGHHAGRAERLRRNRLGGKGPAPHHNADGATRLSIQP